ncbi:hypothetical protein ACHAW5_011295, partial [Stephanodiscus triporus]
NTDVPGHAPGKETAEALATTYRTAIDSIPAPSPSPSSSSDFASAPPPPPGGRRRRPLTNDLNEKYCMCCTYSSSVCTSAIHTSRRGINSNAMASDRRRRGSTILLEGGRGEGVMIRKSSSVPRRDGSCFAQKLISPGLIRIVTMTSAFRSEVMTGSDWDTNSIFPPSWEAVMLTFTIVIVGWGAGAGAALGTQ